MILLDTCAFLWIINDYTELSPAAVKAVKKSNQLFLSPITALEIAIKYKRGKLKLPTGDAFNWYNDSIVFWNITEKELSSEILMASALLPAIHKDPFDRIIVATALKHNATILTADKIIPQYPNVKVIW